MKEEESNKRSNIEMGKTLTTILRKKSQHQMPMLADGNSSININDKNVDGMNLFNLNLTCCLTAYNSARTYLRLLTLIPHISKNIIAFLYGYCYRYYLIYSCTIDTQIDEIAY